MDRPPIIQPKIEVKQERILTKEEVLEKIYILGGKIEELIILDERSDENGLYYLEARNCKTIDEDGYTNGYAFCRKHLNSDNINCAKTNISSVFYNPSNDVEPGGDTLVEFDEAKNVWTDYPPYPRNPDIK